MCAHLDCLSTGGKVKDKAIQEGVYMRMSCTAKAGSSGGCEGHAPRVRARGEGARQRGASHSCDSARESRVHARVKGEGAHHIVARPR